MSPLIEEKIEDGVLYNRMVDEEGQPITKGWYAIPGNAILLKYVDAKKKLESVQDDHSKAISAMSADHKQIVASIVETHERKLQALFNELDELREKASPKDVTFKARIIGGEVTIIECDAVAAPQKLPTPSKPSQEDLMVAAEALTQQKVDPRRNPPPTYEKPPPPPPPPPTRMVRDDGKPSKPSRPENRFPFLSNQVVHVNGKGLNFFRKIPVPPVKKGDWIMKSGLLGYNTPFFGRVEEVNLVQNQFGESFEVKVAESSHTGKLKLPIVLPLGLLSRIKEPAFPLKEKDYFKELEEIEGRTTID